MVERKESWGIGFGKDHVILSSPQGPNGKAVPSSPRNRVEVRRTPEV